jgi:50S ribosomal subunit-associated GTPase HflX
LTDARSLGGELAYIVAVEEGEDLDVESSLEELALLLTNLGVKTGGICIQKRDRPDPGSYLG